MKPLAANGEAAALVFTAATWTSRSRMTWRKLWIVAFAGIIVAAGVVMSVAAENSSAPQAELLAREGSVESARGSTNWIAAEPGLFLNVRDRLRTLALSRATLRLAELGRLRVNELTTLEILPPQSAESRATLDLKAGAIYFFTREKPREFLIQTPYAIGASRGTEFSTEVQPDGRTVLTVFDGEVELTNALGRIVLTNGEQGTVEANQAPVKTAVIETTQVIQWWLYYPGVLDVNELPFTAAETNALAASLTAYRAGDLKAALASVARPEDLSSDATQIYYAGLLLSVGQVDKAERRLNALITEYPAAVALREVIALVTSQPPPPDPPPILATEWLAQSYVQQPTNLQAALVSARQAVAKDPLFGFAWERVAELEFSFGHIRAAGEALESALRLSPRNAQAVALHGFILSAENRVDEAEAEFNRAIALDPALANGWLGRGLIRIRQGNDAGGRADLQTAAAVEPNRSLLRSYLGKAFQNVFDSTHAARELTLAHRLDPHDPTPLLYRALLDGQENRFNEGIGDLEKSVAQNDDRRVYRSQLLLDQDRAVRGANLAILYQRNGMEDVSFREASKAVAADYGNFSAHQFLADSLDALRDPARFNLRYETSWSYESLIAQMLAPVGAGPLSRNISQQEYSKLFEADRFGLTADSSWRSDGQFREVASQFGTFHNSSYAVDVDYQHNEGVRPNNELSRLDLHTTLKQQLSPQDSVQLFVDYQDYHAGDNFQYYDPQAGVRRDLDFNETEDPIIGIGYHREWAPGMHTLVLGGRLHAEQDWSDHDVFLPLLVQAPLFTGLGSVPLDVRYHNDLTIYSAELNQIAQTDEQILVVGTRLQAGQIQAGELVTNPTNGLPPGFFLDPAANNHIDENFRRLTGYGYYTRAIMETLWLTAGISYDDVTYPRNYFDVPIESGEAHKSRWDPKAGLLWTPLPEVTLRSAWARSLGGVSIDQDFRLEPVQVAGFNQTYRNIISDSVVSSVPVPATDLIGVAIDTRLKTRTYITVEGVILQSDNDRTYALFENNGTPPAVPSSTVQRLNYEEHSVIATLNQLIGDRWSAGVQFQFSRADLQSSYPQVAALPPQPNSDVRADLYEVKPYLVFNHPNGLFARAEVPWYSQDNTGYTPALPGDSFYQLNLFAGYRFPRTFGELTLGLLNATGTDYRLNPLNYYAELPRERVWSVRLRLSF